MEAFICAMPSVPHTTPSPFAVPGLGFRPMTSTTTPHCLWPPACCCLIWFLDPVLTSWDIVVLDNLKGQNSGKASPCFSRSENLSEIVVRTSCWPFAVTKLLQEQLMSSSHDPRCNNEENEKIIVLIIIRAVGSFIFGPSKFSPHFRCFWHHLTGKEQIIFMNFLSGHFRPVVCQIFFQTKENQKNCF